MQITSGVFVCYHSVLFILLHVNSCIVYSWLVRFATFLISLVLIYVMWLSWGFAILLPNTVIWNLARPRVIKMRVR